jgi:hypothetical protein
MKENGRKLKGARSVEYGVFPSPAARPGHHDGNKVSPCLEVR